MRSFFFREVIPPNVERRNYLLRKLALIRKDKNAKELKHKLRRELLATHGKVVYYRVNKGLKIKVGEEYTTKKAFLLSKDNRFLEDKMQMFRKQFTKQPKVVAKDRYIEHLDMFVRYNTIGGVMEKPDWMRQEARKLHKKKVTTYKSPLNGDKNPYIGIELEYASKLTIDEIGDKLIDHKLHDEVKVMRDGSIRTNDLYPNQIEFCILTKWSDLHKTLERLRPVIFDKPQHFLANPTCGLHVHIDVRHDDPKRVFRNLTSMQSVLFNLAAEHRRGNTYCRPLTTTNFDEVDADDDDAHYDAISKYSYFKHSTIEVRIHQSTLSLTAIEKWITLLKRIADYKGNGMKLGTFDSEFKILKENVQIEQDLVKYIEERKIV